jgi:hypothetical protein
VVDRIILEYNKIRERRSYFDSVSLLRAVALRPRASLPLLLSLFRKVKLTRQAQEALAGEGEQDLLGAAGDGQAAGVEEVVNGLVLYDARALRQLHP